MLEDDQVAEDPEDTLLLVAILLRRFVEELDEDRVVQELGADHESFHLVADVDRDVALGDHRLACRGSPVPELHTEDRFCSGGRRRRGTDSG